MAPERATPLITILIQSTKNIHDEYEFIYEIYIQIYMYYPNLYRCAPQIGFIYSQIISTTGF